MMGCCSFKARNMRVECVNKVRIVTLKRTRTTFVYPCAGVFGLVESPQKPISLNIRASSWKRQQWVNEQLALCLALPLPPFLEVSPCDPCAKFCTNSVVQFECTNCVTKKMHRVVR